MEKCINSGATMALSYYLVWDYWYSNGYYYAIYELEERLFFSEASTNEINNFKELLKRKPKLFSKEWLKKLFRRIKEK